MIEMAGFQPKHFRWRVNGAVALISVVAIRITLMVFSQAVQ